MNETFVRKLFPLRRTNDLITIIFISLDQINVLLRNDITKGTTTMKQLLVIAIALASTTAFASRARVTSLGNSAHITDTQSVFSNPAKMFLMGDFVSLESGKTATDNTGTIGLNKQDNAEGAIVRTMGDAKVGLALGHKSENASVYGLRNLLTNVTVGGSSKFEQQNPIEISYGMKSGDMTWAGTLVYSNYNDKKNEVKENSAGLRLGLLMGAWDINAGIGLASQVKDKTTTPAVDFKGTGSYSVFAGYTMGSLYTYGEATIAGAKMEAQANGQELAKVDVTRFSVGAIESMKKDGNEFFYGAKLASYTQKEKVNDQKITTLSLPVTLGMEAEATSWLTLRGSLTQTVLLANNKKETGATLNNEEAPGANNTKAAIGAGLKFNKITVDGSLEGLTTDATGAANQQLDGDTLLTTVGMTYMF